MTINKFAEIIREKLIERLEHVKEIKIKEVLKNNSVKYNALEFVNEKSNVAPTIYLEEFYEEYKGEATIEDIVERITRCYLEARIEGDIDLDFICDWEKAQAMLVYRVVNTSRNQELLEQIPHVNIMDLSMIFYLSIKQGTGTMLVYNHHCKMWGIDVEELIRVAKENTPQICPMQLKTMGEVIEELTGSNVNEAGEMYILSNKNRVYGAATLFYPDSMVNVAERLRSDLYILPSSIHELIILPAKFDDKPDKLVEMVREVNEVAVNEDEILGDNVYFYNRTQQELFLVA